MPGSARPRQGDRPKRCSIGARPRAIAGQAARPSQPASAGMPAAPAAAAPGRPAPAPASIPASSRRPGSRAAHRPCAPPSGGSSPPSRRGAGLPPASVRPIQIGPAAFMRRGERAVVDDLAADRREAPGRARRRRGRSSTQPPGGGGGAGARAVRPAEGVEHLEEEDEGRDQPALGRAVAAQAGHERDERRGRSATARCTRPAQAVRRVADIGIGEAAGSPGPASAGRRVETLLQRPELAGPARPAGRAGDHRSRGSPAAAARAIAAVPSVLRSSTTTRRGRRRDSPAPAGCAPSRPIVSASSRAGTMAVTGGQAARVGQASRVAVVVPRQPEAAAAEQQHRPGQRGGQRDRQAQRSRPASLRPEPGDGVAHRLLPGPGRGGPARAPPWRREKYMRCPAMRSPSSVSIGSRPVTRATASAPRASGQSGARGSRTGAPRPSSAGDMRQQLAERHVLPAQDVPLAHRARMQRGDAARGAVVDMHQVQPGIDIGRHLRPAPLPGSPGR